MASLFNKFPFSLHTFKQLGRPSQKAIIWRWAIECNDHPLADLVLPKLPSKVDSPSDIPESLWDTFIKHGSEYFQDEMFRYMEIPTEAVQNIILSLHDEISEDYESWEDYQNFYGDRDVPNHPEVNRFPCLAPEGDLEVFEDGWHRLHSYVNQGHKTIPILEY